MRRLPAVFAASALVAIALGARANAPDIYPSHMLRSGGVHFHTAYSDGAPHTRPLDAYRAGKAAGMDFMFVTEHSEWLSLPVEADEDCLNPTVRPASDCIITTPDGIAKWDAQAEVAVAETTPGFLALRGFEWSSPTQGHVVTVLSENHENAYLDGGPATMRGFYQWLQLDPDLRGGFDALGIFAHPGREELKFEEFRYDPAVDASMVGVEAFNRGKSNEYFAGGLAQALDSGWHTGAIGSADDHGPNWGRADRARTVLVIPDGEPWNEATVREALFRRRFYATHKHSLQLRFQANGQDMGARLAEAPGDPVTLRVEAFDPAPEGSPITGIDLYTAGGTLFETVPGPFPDNHAVVEVATAFPVAGELWYVAKVRTADGRNAFSSPIWLDSA